MCGEEEGRGNALEGSGPFRGSYIPTTKSPTSVRALNFFREHHKTISKHPMLLPQWQRTSRGRHVPRLKMVPRTTSQKNYYWQNVVNRHHDSSTARHLEHVARSPRTRIIAMEARSFFEGSIKSATLWRAHANMKKSLDHECSPQHKKLVKDLTPGQPPNVGLV